MDSLSETDVTADLKRVSDNIGRNPSVVDYHEHGKFDVERVVDLFGSWEDARSRASVDGSNTKWGWYWQQKNNGTCALCDEDFAKCLTFHHRDGVEKIEGVGRMARYAEYDLDDLKAEAEKCVLICQNCHKKVHASDHPASI